jgi:hypothetical protein
MLAALAGCKPPPDAAVVAELTWVERSSPIADAAKTLAMGDHRLIAVYGLALDIPGVDPTKRQSYRALYGIRQIEGTTDGALSARHAALVKEAREYARRYNGYILDNAPPSTMCSGEMPPCAAVAVPRRDRR